jgi:hypothetical protein
MNAVGMHVLRRVLDMMRCMLLNNAVEHYYVCIYAWYTLKGLVSLLPGEPGADSCSCGVTDDGVTLLVEAIEGPPLALAAAALSFAATAIMSVESKFNACI